jgi:hypothetical protein
MAKHALTLKTCLWDDISCLCLSLSFFIQWTRWHPIYIMSYQNVLQASFVDFTSCLKNSVVDQLGTMTIRWYVKWCTTCRDAKLEKNDAVMQRLYQMKWIYKYIYFLRPSFIGPWSGSEPCLLCVLTIWRHQLQDVLNRIRKRVKVHTPKISFQPFVPRRWHLHHRPAMFITLKKWIENQWTLFDNLSNDTYVSPARRFRDGHVTHLSTNTHVSYVGIYSSIQYHVSYWLYVQDKPFEDAIVGYCRRTLTNDILWMFCFHTMRLLKGTLGR